jgi:hypothetical protein
MKIGIKNSIPRLRLKKPYLIGFCLVFLCSLLMGIGIKSCMQRKYKVNEYVLEKISKQFEPVITDVYLKLQPEKQLNTKLIYSVYITEFDTGKDVKVETAERLTRCFYDKNNKFEIIPKEDADSIFDSVEKEFNIELKKGKRQEMLLLAEDLPPGYIDSTYILKKGLVSINGDKTNIGLANFAYNALSCKSGYIYGAVGQKATLDFLYKQQNKFKNNDRAELNKENIDFIFKNYGGRPSFDCCGLIKAYSWFDEETGEIQPNRKNAIKDCTADGLYNLAEVKGNISDMPDIPGLAVHKSGHIGVYVGGGEVIEAQGNKYGVLKTKLAGRGWEHYLKVPTLKYINSGTFKLSCKEVTLLEEKIVNKNEF